MPLHPQVQCPQTAQHEEAVLRPGHPAHRVLKEAEALGDRLVRGDSHAQDRIGVAGQILRGGMEDDVGAEHQRPLVGRRSERVVDDDERTTTALSRPPRDDLCHGCDIDDLQVGVRGRLEPDEPGPLRQSFPEGVGPRREVDVLHRDAGTLADSLQIAKRPTVDVVADDDLVARGRQLGDRGCRGRP